MITEAFLHFCWKMKLFNLNELRTSCGKALEIIFPGVHNHNAGPDFQHARIKIGDTLWNGHVEIHVRNSDWDLHGHSDDPSYKNVILHVVYDLDREVKFLSGKNIPLLALNGKIPALSLSAYRQMLLQKRTLPCAGFISQYPAPLLRSAMIREFVAHMEDQELRLQKLFLSVGSSREDLFILLCGHAFGLKENRDAFDKLISLYLFIPKPIRKKHSPEALLFGLSGLVKGGDEWQDNILTQFMVLNKEFSIDPMRMEEWKFSRMRPSGFPTLRIALLAELLKMKNLYLKLSSTDAGSLRNLVNKINLSAPAYWDDKYSLNTGSHVPQTKKMGGHLRNLWILHAVIPWHFYINRKNKEPEVIDSYAEWLEKIRGSDNFVMRMFASAGVKAQDTLAEFSLTRIHKTRCSYKKCLDCEIGAWGIRQNQNL